MVTLYEHYTDIHAQIAETVSGPYWISQTFTVGNTGPNNSFSIRSLRVLMYREGNPGIITASITETSGGVPSGPDLSVGYADGNVMTESPSGEMVEFEMSPYTLSASRQYAIVIRATDATILNWIIVYADKEISTYTGGAFFVGNFDYGWNVLYDGDIFFDIYGDPVDEGYATITNINAPSQAQEGESVQVSPTIRNDGTVADDLWLSLTDTDTGELIGQRQSANHAQGESLGYSWNITMPAKNLNLRIDVGHVE